MSQESSKEIGDENKAGVNGPADGSGQHKNCD
jgi:hypothetical protein